MRLRGKLGRYGFDVKSYDVGETRATADFAPVYGASEHVPSWRLRELTRAALAEHARDVLDPMPAELELPLRRDALATLHFPADAEEAEEARKRLALDELLALQLAVLRSRDEDAVATPLGEPGELVARYRAALPFELTEHQEHAIAEIDRDLARTVPMQRLLQGDVGSGKTVVAAVRAAARRRGGTSGSLHGADGNPRRAALSHGRDALRRARRARRAADGHVGLEARPGGDRDRRGADRGRHARADPGRRRVRRPRGRRRRRAAPLRRRAAAARSPSGGRRTCCT